MTRTFIAIALPDHVKEALGRQIAALEEALPRGVRWAAADGLHLTLAFLGELDDDRLAEAEQAALVAAREGASFTLRLTHLGSFGPARSPRVIWAGVSGSPDDLSALGNLQGRLASELELRDFPPEERPFAPHLTLARVKESLPPEAARELPALLAATASERADFTVREICVMKSERLRTGALYSCLRACALEAQNEAPDA
jgi:2'-5' RNA ligase